MTDTNSKPSSSIVNTLIWAGSAVAITAMVVFAALPRFLPAQPPVGQMPPNYQYQQSYAPPPGYQQPQPQYPQAYPQQLPQEPMQPAPPIPPQQAAVQPQIGVTPISGLSVDDGFEFNSPDLSQQVINVTKKTKSVLDVPAGVTPTDKNTIIAFVDPTCPYCQQAHKFLNDKYVVRYVPIDVLTNGTGVPNIRGVLRAPDGAGALRKLMTGDAGGLNTTADPALDKDLTASLEVFAAIVSKMPQQRPAVPLFLIPKTDGRLAAVQGWNDSMPTVLKTFMNM